MDGNIETEGSIDDYNVGLNFVSVGLPSGKHAQLIARNDMTVKELLSSICEVLYNYHVLVEHFMCAYNYM